MRTVFNFLEEVLLFVLLLLVQIVPVWILFYTCGRL